MLLVKKVLVTGLLTVGVSLPVFAQTPDVHIANYTDYTLTSRINDGYCSSYFGSAGVTQPQERDHIISGSLIGFACSGGDPTHCKTDIYLSGDCSGSPVATAILDTSAGVTSIAPDYIPDLRLHIKPSGFYITVTQDPAVSR